MNNNKNKIARVILQGFISITIISILVSGVFWVLDIYGIYQDEIKLLKAEFIKDRKTVAKSEVEDVVEFIQYSRSKAEINLKNVIKSRLYIAYDIALNIYNENIDSKSKSQIKDMIKDALRPIRFNNGRGYYFAATLEGIDELYPVYPELEGTDITGLQDEMGNYVIKNELEMVNQQDEGYLIDFWKKPEFSDGMIYPKITFVKKFEQLNWYLGTGDYLDDFEKDIKQEVLDRLSEIRFGAEGYIFVNKFDGSQLITNGELVKTKKNMKDIIGTDGVELLEKELRAANKLNGDFIEYSFNKMGSNELSPKISFIKGIMDWEWIIGAGFYIDDVESKIEIVETEKRNQINKNLVQILTIILSLLLLSIIIARVLFLKIKKNFQVFENFFNTDLKESEKIDMEKLDYAEFHQLAELVNTMIDEIVEDRNTIIKNELKYKNLVENQGEGVVIGDLEENLEFANPAASRILGTPVENLHNRTLKDFLTEEEFNKVKEQTKNRIEGISSTYELSLNRPDGEKER